MSTKFPRYRRSTKCQKIPGGRWNGGGSGGGMAGQARVVKEGAGPCSGRGGRPV